LSVKLGVPGGFLPLAVLASASGRVAANGKFSIGLDLEVGIDSDSSAAIAF